MDTNKNTSGTLEDIKVNVKLKLSALWVALMFIYVYVDIFAFFEPGALEHILAGKVWVLDITQTWALSALILMTIPSLMIFLSLTLATKVNRRVNIIVAIFYIIVAIGNPIGETWLVIWAGSLVEIAILVLIVWNSWKWTQRQATL